MMTPDMKVTGRFDDAFAAGARPIIEKLAGELRDVTVDMSEATEIDAAGLGALVYLYKRLDPLGCTVRVLGANDRVQGIFARFHLADLFIEGAARPASTALRSCFFGIRPQGSAARGALPGIAGKKVEPEASKESNIDRVGADAGLDGTAARSIRAWLDASTDAGGQVRGSDALKSYRRWAGKGTEAGDAMHFRAHLAAILGTDRVISRTSGYVVRGIQLHGGGPRAARSGAIAVPCELLTGSLPMKAISAVSR